ncbi:peptidase inhibitor family I36 protein [Streptomyces anthocyanicus]|uniref:peptidase inhibitor family I36 protein n=1 Tax=Streptomyces anthocyanicus TaxID=68174 RepID=UPI002F914769|nr:peptidase inhibitor family I36 protein [Streptomyces anthocyanicus]
MIGLVLAGVSASSIVLGATGPASADQWGIGNCDPSVYKFCFYEKSNYSGSSVGISWGDAANHYYRVSKWGFMNNNISSVKNNTNYSWCLYDRGDLKGEILKVSPFHQLSGLGSADNKTESFGIC